MPTRVHMIGQRGIPATYGGIERHVEEVGASLTQLGIAVTVYSRDGYNNSSTDDFRGITISRTRAMNGKHTEALSHSLIATLRAIAQSPDIIHYHGLGPGVWAALVRPLRRTKTVLTVHGLDHDREKWNVCVRTLFGVLARISIASADAIIVVSEDLKGALESSYGRTSTFIPNGVSSIQLPETQESYS